MTETFGTAAYWKDRAMRFEKLAQDALAVQPTPPVTVEVRAVTRDEVEEYVQTLDPSMTHLFNECTLIYLEDTLEDSFQIWAEIMDVFKKYAARSREGRS